MIQAHHDLFWNGTALGCGATLRPWLYDHGSLTQRIEQRCEKFTVLPVRSGLARIAYDEAALLGIAPHQLAYSREVFLYADGKPVVFAHSTCRADDLCGAWKAMRGLGNRSLGSLLFSHPLVVRQPLHFKALRAQHPLVGRALARQSSVGRHPQGVGRDCKGLKPQQHTHNPDLQSVPDALWARRSLFTLHGAPLLVTEVFLPEILRLK